MRRRFTTALLIAAGTALTGTQASAVITWTGAGADPSLLFAADNWDFSASSAVSVDAGIENMDDISFLNATVSTTDQPTFDDNLRIGNGFTATFDNTTFITGGVGGLNGVDDDPLTIFSVGDPSFVNIINASVVNLQYFSEGIVMNVDGTSSLTFRGGGDPINSQSEGVDLNLAPGAQLTLPTLEEFAEQGADILVKGFAYASGGVVVNPTILSIAGTTATAVDFIPGDADGDGDIDDTDLGISISNFTGPVGDAGGKFLADGDTDGDGDVDDTDLGVSISGFTGPLSPAAVPEPASLALITLGGLLVARRRRG